MPEGCYFMERAVDAMARKLGLDPIEFRRRNLPRREGPSEGEADFEQLLDALVRSSRYEELRGWRVEMLSRFRQSGPSRSTEVVGLGVSITGGEEDEEEDEDWGNEGSDAEGAEKWSGGGGSGGQWPAKPPDGQEAWKPGGQSSGGNWPKAGEETLSFMSETARVAMDKGGRVTVYTGSSPHGQGEETTFAQLAADELGVPLENVRVVWGDTVLIPRGIGTFGSRSAATGGSAVVDACRKLKAQLLGKASETLGADAKSLEIRGGFVVIASRPDEPLASLMEVVQKQGDEEVSASSVFTLSDLSYSSGVHLCVVTLDVELGKVRIAKYFVVEDCGRMINKTIVEGQLHGGVVHAVGGALFERLAYDSEGNLLSSTFMDYNIPTALDSPDVEVAHQVTPSTVTLTGVKGVGESGTNGAYAAVINAVNDAISQVKPGAEINVAPATPDAIFRVLSQSGA